MNIMHITLDQLKAIVPTLPKNGDVFIKYLNETMERYGITTPKRKAFFISELAHESMGFSRTQEIATGKAYENRADLGNIYKGDGVRFKGRGLLQITGRDNYRTVGKALNIDFVTRPILLESPSWATISAGWFWDNRKLNGFADLPDEWRSKTKNYSPFEYVTYRINGGLTHIEDRKKYLQRALSVFS